MTYLLSPWEFYLRPIIMQRLIEDNSFSMFMVFGLLHLVAKKPLMFRHVHIYSIISTSDTLHRWIYILWISLHCTLHLCIWFYWFQNQHLNMNCFVYLCSPILDVSGLFAEMVQRGLRCIAFCRSRKLCELFLCVCIIDWCSLILHAWFMAFKAVSFVICLYLVLLSMLYFLPLLGSVEPIELKYSWLW